jgi:hypothetical protein
MRVTPSAGGDVARVAGQLPVRGSEYLANGSRISRSRAKICGHPREEVALMEIADLEHLDISNLPELLRIVEEVRRTNEPRVLTHNSEDLALLLPMVRPRKRSTKGAKTRADFEAFRSAAGGWKDVDTHKLIEDIYASRRISDRPPVEL